MKKLTLIISLLWVCILVNAQAPNYKQLSYDSTANFYDICSAVETYFDTTGYDTIEGGGFGSYLRWRSFWSSRVGDSTNHGSFSPAVSALAELMNSDLCSGGTYNEEWENVGHRVTESSGSWSRGQGRIVFVHVDILNDATGATIYVGSDYGGLWRTTTGNNTTPTWTCLTNQKLPGLGVNGMAIDPTDPDIIYISTGIGYGDNFTYGMGILKTENGQNSNPTWSSTGLTFDLSNPNNFILTQGVYISPDDNDVIFALMKNQIFKSTNGGSTFTSVHTNTDGKRYFKDLVFMPSDADIILASTNDGIGDGSQGGALVIRSTNGGSSFSTVSVGFTSERGRIDLAVTEADEDMVVAGGAAINGGGYQLFVSTDNGTNFTQKNATGASVGNVGYWYQDIVISPITLIKFI